MKSALLTGVILVMSSFFVSAQDASWFSDISVSPEKIYSGTNTTVQVRLKIGSTRQKRVVITGGVDNVQLFSKTIEIKPKMRAQNFKFDWKATSLGEHKVYFEIKGNDKLVKQTKKQKKILVEQIMTTTIDQQVVAIQTPQPECEGLPLPDIVVPPLGGEEIGYNPPGSILTKTVVLKNLGQCETGVFMVRVKFRTHYQGTKESDWKYYTIVSIPPEKGQGKGTRSLAFEFQTLNVNNAEYDFIIEADYDEQVNEFREDNNKRHAEGRFKLKSP